MREQLKLFVADAGDFKLRFLQEPADVETGNLLRVLDWSADSRRLLVELAEWQNEQPGVSRGVLIYDSKNGTFQQPEMAHILAKTYSRDCSLNLRVMGFSAQGAIVLEGQPLSPEEEEIQGMSSCAKKRTFFSLIAPPRTWSPLPKCPSCSIMPRWTVRSKISSRAMPPRPVKALELPLP